MATAGRIRMPSSRSSVMTSEPSSIPNFRRIRAGTTIAPLFPTRLVSVRVPDDFLTVGLSGITATISADAPTRQPQAHRRALGEALADHRRGRPQRALRD